jgi:hypothetical protein
MQLRIVEGYRHKRENLLIFFELPASGISWLAGTDDYSVERPSHFAAIPSISGGLGCAADHALIKAGSSLRGLGSTSFMRTCSGKETQSPSTIACCCANAGSWSKSSRFTPLMTLLNIRIGGKADYSGRLRRRFSSICIDLTVPWNSRFNRSVLTATKPYSRSYARNSAEGLRKMALIGEPGQGRNHRDRFALLAHEFLRALDA